MLYSEKIETFERDHPGRTITVRGASFRYELSGPEGARTLVF